MPPSPLILTRAQARALDQAAATELAIPTILLMEHAAASLERHTLELLNRIAPPTPLPPTAHGPSPTAPSPPPLILLFCGPGNNGGDGHALARLLHLKGIPVHIFAVGPTPDESRPPTTDAAINRAIALRLALPITTLNATHEAQMRREFDALIAGHGRVVMVDALLGTGASRPLDDAMTTAVRVINGVRAAHNHTRTLAVDIPTGMDADTGFALENKPFSAHDRVAREAGDPTIVRADLTVTLAALKPGLMRDHARPYTGRVEVGDIGLPATFIARFASNANTAR